MRAMIRAHVRAAANHNEEAQAYLCAAQAYLSKPPAVVLAIGGLQGTGKSTLARILASEWGAAPGALVLRSDEIRKRLHGVSPEDRLPEIAYSNHANAAVADVLVEQARSVAAGGHTVILDATFLDPGLRRRVAAAMEIAKVRFIGIWLHAPLSVLEARINARHADASDATVAILRRASAKDPGNLDWLAVEASQANAALAALRRAVANKR
jgi:uncharacterized protein